MYKPQKDELLERLLFSEGLVETYTRPEQELCGDHWTRPVLLERVAYLRKLARFGEGAASDSIREFPGYSLQLNVLLRSSDAVADEKNRLIFLVIDGDATLVRGGVLERPMRTSAGEVRGAGIEGGNTSALRRGDVVHIEAATPHSFQLSGEKGFAFLKVQISLQSGYGPTPGL
jgi:mannose-6-phosphate isomerase-like protein (cupin superfamily)